GDLIGASRFGDMSHLRTLTSALHAVRAAIRDQLTIIIPALNCSEYLPAAAASAIHSPAGRIWIADDGSNPDALAVAARVAAAHPDRIRLLASPLTRGTATNMNEAAKLVETPYFTKLDGDDVLIPGYLESAFPIIAAKPRLAILAGHDTRIAADEAVEFRPELLPGARPGEVRIMRAAEAYKFIVVWDPNPCSSGVIYRTEAFRQIGGYDSRIQWGEDWEIWLRFGAGWEVGHLHAPSALYRMHQQPPTAAARRQNRL